MRIVFVCTGNICRSPFAERLASQWGHPAVVAQSAGVHALVGAAMDSDMAAQLSARGGDPSGFCARQVEHGLLAAADVVLTMERDHRGYVVRECPEVTRRSFTLGQFARGVELLRDAGSAATGSELVQEIYAARVPSTRALSVPDPYRRGPRVAGEVAAVLEDWVSRSVLALAPGV